MTHNNNYGGKFQYRVIRWAAVIICVYLIVTTLGSMVDLYHAKDKLTSRQTELAQLNKERDDLLREKNKVAAPDYLEKVARDDLGLSKPGEQVVVIDQSLLGVAAPAASPDATPNWQKWAKLIF
ncbi:MAG: septum formation initiator family protein [Patescibacteria group bacterium]|nr:septum formation initiator family protein [Patescibacteria group bacterium]